MIYIYKIKLIKESTQFKKTFSKQVFFFTYFVKLFLLTQSNVLFLIFENKKLFFRI